MMERLMERARTIAHAAQAERLQQIAGTLRERGIAAETAADSVVLRGRRLVQQWLADPLVRFAGRNGA
jgi:hypothetical protein